MRLERAGRTDDERAHHEGGDLVTKHVHAHDGRRDVLVADGDEGSAGAAAEEIRAAEHGERHRGEREEVVGPFGIEHERPEGRRGDPEDPLAAAGHGNEMDHEPLDHHLGGERRDD